MSSEHTSPENAAPEQSSPTHASAEASVPEITSARATAAQEQLMTQYQRDTAQPEHAEIETARAGLEQQAAIEAQKQRTAQLVAGRGIIAQQLQTPSSSPVPLVAAGTVVTAGTLYGLQKFDPIKIVQDAVGEVIKKPDNIADIANKFKLPENSGIDVSNILSSTVDTVKGYGDKKGLVDTLKTKIGESLQKMEGAPELKDKVFEKLADAAKNGKVDKVKNIIPKETATDVIVKIQEQVAEAAAKHKDIWKEAEPLQKAVKDSLQEGGASKVMNNIVEFRKKIPVNDVVLVGTAVVGLLAAHHVATAGERQERQENKEVYGQYTAEIARQQQELAELVTTGPKRYK